ncbi:MAG: DNA-processing protein DprA [Treponema sp.]|nr:DNA-processing protein DprA [Treponema sp.]MCL2250996.1 DNA-processing protein DprA [Treponema sp.]
MNEQIKLRGLLDLIISLLPEIKLTEKIILLQNFDTVEQLFIQSKRDIELILNRQLKEFWDITEIIDKAGRIDTICRIRSIKWVSWMEEEYPPLLREIYDPPAVLFFIGTLPHPEKPLIGIVGTRKPSPEAAEQTYKIAGNLSRLGVSVISGLALGIDAMAHRGNLIGSSPAYAVLGSGIDEIYPSANRPLAKRILDSGGAIISEYPPGVHPSKWTFPARNRIISAFSRSVLVAEAPLKSGALITAAFALEQGKDLWVASEGIEENSFDKRGTIKLANDGAEVIHSASDVMEKWNMTETMTQTSFVPSNRRDVISSMASLLKIDF